MAKLFRTYLFREKDPAIDECRTAIQAEGLFERLGTVSKLSGMSTSQLNNWFHGTTRDPRNSSVNAVMTSLGYERSWNRKRRINLEEELAASAKFYNNQERKNKAKKK